VIYIISRQNCSISSQSTDLNASQHLSPLASTTLKADGKSGKYDKMLLLQLARSSSTTSEHCNYSDIYCAFNKKMRFCCFFSMASTLSPNAMAGGFVCCGVEMDAVVVHSDILITFAEPVTQ
jgi:hypothetical protein